MRRRGTAVDVGGEMAMQASSTDLFDTSPATLSPALERAAVRALAAFIIAMASTAHAAECLSSANAVWSAHPGSHATWRARLPGHIGEKCWFVRGSTNLAPPRVRHVAFPEADSRTDGQGNRASSPVKASAADRPEESPARSQSQETLGPTERGPSSILIWGTPMRIDPTWDEMFTRRERRAE
jgi:hypothetical protein